MHFLSHVMTSIFLPIVLLGAGPSLPPADQAPILTNPGFECSDGYHDQVGINGMVANGWAGRNLVGSPYMGSTQFWESMGTSCTKEPNLLEKVEGYDSNVFLATYTEPYQGFDAPPFDVALYQRVKVAPGVEYSLSAWMVSLCGGSGSSDGCPSGAYIAKLAGLDATGGTDPLADAVEWTEDRRPHTEIRWANLVTATTAQASTLTVFLRVDSPFPGQGNHAFADAVKLVRAPTSRFDNVSAQGSDIAVTWSGDLGPDIPNIPSPSHDLWFELQVRRADGPWEVWLSREAAGGQTYAAPPSCRDELYQFRIRAWGDMSARPYNRFAGVWHESAKLLVRQSIGCSDSVYPRSTPR